MAAVVIGTGGARPSTVAGYEVNDKTVMTANVEAGTLLQYTGNYVNKFAEMRPLPAGQLEAHGIALKKYVAGQRGCDVGIQGEMDGFTGLTSGTPLFPSGSVAGGIDTTQPDGAPVRMRATSPTRIRYNFV